MASAANEWIFISYRRDDTAAQAAWLADQLRLRFSGGAVFLDQQGIDWGVDFDKVLAHRVNAALVVLVLIGPKWLSTLQDRAKLVAQAASARDYVRTEVAAALARAGSLCMLLPVLCGTANMPEAPALEAAGFADLAGLCTAVEVVPINPIDGSLHRRLIPLLGLALGEMFNFETLAARCRATDRWTFLFTAAPLKIPGALGSPGNALAIL